jgi:hypothetical protein
MTGTRPGSPIRDSAEAAKIARLLGEFRTLAADPALDPAAADAFAGFAGALGDALDGTEADAPGPGWFELAPSEERPPVLRLAGSGRGRLIAAACGVADPAPLAALVRLLLDASMRLQQVDGGGQAADDLVELSAAFVPVLEAVGASLHPLAGLGALAAVSGEAEFEAAFGPIAMRLAELPRTERSGALRDLAAMTEVLLEDPDRVPVGQAMLAGLIGVATSVGPSGESSADDQE